jgi:hypothetical protein
MEVFLSVGETTFGFASRHVDALSDSLQVFRSLNSSTLLMGRPLCYWVARRFSKGL